MRVYKFLNAKYGLECVLRKRLKISHFDALNDPFDCHAVKFDTAITRKAWQNTIIGLGKNRGLACFSMGYENPLLWSHYADDHKGMVLGFDLDGSVSVLKMQYTSVFLDARHFEKLNNEEKLVIVKKALSRKFIQWKYEREVRAFVSLDHNSVEDGLYFLNFNNDFRLAEVILGVRHHEVASASQALSASGVPIRQAWLSGEKYEVVCI